MKDPSEDDYQIYMIVNFIKSLSMVNESLLNKNLSYLAVYYSLVDLIFENNCTLKEYHFDWFEKCLDQQNM